MNKFIVKEGESYSKPIAFLKEQKEKVFFLEGDLGAGKTSFTIEFLKSLCGDEVFKSLGVMSPTYSIVNEYLLKEGLILHSDFYRVDEESFDWEEFLERLEESSFAFIEWGTKIPQLSENISTYSTIKIKILDNKDREVSIIKG